MKAMPNLTETSLETLRRLGGRGLHVEAAARHRRVHDVRPVHQRVPGARHRQAARPARDRAEDRRGDGGQRRRTATSARRSATTSEITISAQLAVRADHRRGDLGVHQLQGVRRDLPGQHRDPRQDPRHAPLPVADGEQLPGRARQRVPGDGEPGQPVGHEPGRARRLGQGPRDVAVVDPGEPLDHRVPLLGRLRRLVRRQEQEGHAGDGQAAAPGRHRRGRSSDRARCAPATRPAAAATSTCSRCWRCRTSRCSTAWA